MSPSRADTSHAAVSQLVESLLAMQDVEGSSPFSRSMGKVIWLTGLPCSGKTTIAKVIVERTGAEFLDGDDLRDSDFSKGIGFTPEERKRHLLRVGYLAKRLSKYNDVICSFVSPAKDVREQLPVDIMVYVKCPVSVCAERDVKGMYAKANRGEIKNFTGISAPYQAPEDPDVTVETDKETLEESVQKVLEAISAPVV